MSANVDKTCSKSKPYRPSNGTEGEIFEAQFCSQCEHEAAWRRDDLKHDACKIHARVYAFGINDPQYPKEWIEDEDGPHCTAFLIEGSTGHERLERDRARYEAAMSEMRKAHNS